MRDRDEHSRDVAHHSQRQVRDRLRQGQAEAVRQGDGREHVPHRVDVEGVGRAASGPRGSHGARPLLPPLLVGRVQRRVRALRRARDCAQARRRSRPTDEGPRHRPHRQLSLSHAADARLARRRREPARSARRSPSRPAASRRRWQTKAAAAQQR